MDRTVVHGPIACYAHSGCSRPTRISGSTAATSWPSWQPTASRGVSVAAVAQAADFGHVTFPYHAASPNHRIDRAVPPSRAHQSRGKCLRGARHRRRSRTSTLGPNVAARCHRGQDPPEAIEITLGEAVDQKTFQPHRVQRGIGPAGLSVGSIVNGGGIVAIEKNAMPTESGVAAVYRYAV